MPDGDEERRRMVARQLRARGIRDPRILEAFETVPRERFVPSDYACSAYEDRPLPIGEGQTISQPYIVARMIETAAIGPNDRVLEVGAGSGYAAAILSRLAASVVAVERHETLALAAESRVTALGYANCSIRAGDGMAGAPDLAPFDAILVAARSASIPEALKQQLAIGGRLIIPVGGEDVQHLRRITRDAADHWHSEDMDPVRFVPLLPGVVPDTPKR